jgi:rhamnosyltransferase
MIASIIIITKNQKNLLQKSLPKLLRQKFSGNFEIIVVDSGSTDGAVDYTKKMSIKLVEISPDDFNYAYAFNCGAKIANGKYLIRLSGDAIPVSKNLINELTKPFKDDKVGGTYGKYVLTGKSGFTYPNFWSKDRFPPKQTRYTVKPSILSMIWNRNHTEKVMNFAGGCCALRKSLWEVRPFNENLIGGDDADFALFMHLLGYSIVYNPKAQVFHEHKMSEINIGLIKEVLWRMIFAKEIFKLMVIDFGIYDKYAKQKV